MLRTALHLTCTTRDFLETNSHSRQQIDALAYDLALRAEPTAYDASFICGFNASYLPKALQSADCLTAVREATKDDAHLADCLAAHKHFVPLILTSLMGAGARTWSHIDHIWATSHAEDLKRGGTGRTALSAKQHALVELWCGSMRAATGGVAALIRGERAKPTAVAARPHDPPADIPDAPHGTEDTA